MNIKNIPAKAVSYGGTRPLTSIKGIVLHYTAGTGDTAENNGRYFATGNTRAAGAHFFVGQDGTVVQSIPLNRIAWAIGSGPGVLTNANTVSIELCDNATRDPSEAQISAVRELVAYIRSQCPNATTICRHFDVGNRKRCPARMCDDAVWNAFLAKITTAPATAPQTPATAPTNGSYRVRVDCSVLNVRRGPGTNYSIRTKVRQGEVYTIVEEQNGWGKLKSGAGWISLAYTKRV